MAQALTAVVLGLALAIPVPAHASGRADQSARPAQGQSPQGIAASSPSTPVREASAQGPLAHAEDPEVRAPVDAYLRGHETGDAAQFRRAFAKDARLWWVRDGQVATRTAEEYIASVSGRRRADPDHRRRLVSLQVAGDFAVATIEIDYPGVRLTDQLTLQKLGDEWRIVVKSFSSEPRTAA
jgi:hypothetical protein